MSVLVCRTCLYANKDIQVFKAIDKVKDILKIIVPEINYFTSCVICTQCYYFLKNVENFKIKCTQVQKQLVSFNFKQLQYTSNDDQISYSRKRTYSRKQVGNKNPQSVLKENKPRRTYTRKKNLAKTDQNVAASKQPKQIYNDNPQKLINHAVLEHPAPYHNQANVTVTSESTILQNCCDYVTPEAGNSHQYNNVTHEPHNFNQYNNYMTYDPNLPSPETNWNRSVLKTNFRQPVVQPNPNYAARSQQLIDKLFDVVSPVYETTKNERIIDLAEFISQENEEVPVIESENTITNEVSTTSVQEINIQETDSTGIIVDRLPNENTVFIEASDIIELISESENEMNNFEDNCDDDIFEEKLTIVKNEVEEEENPSFFNKQTESGSYDCKLCSKKYKTSKGLYEHTQMKHPELKFYHCEICNFFTLWRSALMRHTDLFHNIGEVDTLEFLFCYHCSFRTASKCVLEKHIVNMHFSSDAMVIQ